MKQIWISKAGSPDVLELREAKDPVVTDSSILIDVKAAGINFADIMARLGIYPDAPKIPCVVGYEVAGVVQQVGSSVSHFAPGMRVIGMTRFGGYSSKIALKENQIFPLPEGWSFEEGAGFPVNYLTAYQLLVVMGSIRHSNSVLVHNAGGGVGTAATQLAKIYNAEVFGTASKHKHPYITENGVLHAIDYRTKDFVKEVNRLTDGRGVDLVIDPIGGKHFAHSYEVLKKSGRLLMFGVSTMAQSKSRSYIDSLKMLFSTPMLKFHPINLMNQNKGVLGVNLGHLWDETEMVREWAYDLLAWANEGKIRPYVDRTFSFEEAAKAHHYLQDRKNLGKVCLIP